MTADPFVVLVVDDSVTIRARLRADLEADGHTVHEATDGDEAILQAHLVKPDVVLMDITMPRMDGLSAVRELGAQPATSDIPVVMLTVHDQVEDKQRAFEAGAHDFLAKPFDPLELIVRVRAAGSLGRTVRKLRDSVGELDRMANQDLLTGLPNRRSVDRSMKANEAIAVTVFVMDVDHFKSVNDRFGHDVGDEVLALVADRLRMSLRDADIVGRWGGEEFIALLNHADPERVEAIGERVLAAVSQATGLAEGPERVTLSIGAASRTSAGTPIDVLLRQADAALYEAKAAGRARLVVAAPPQDGAEGA